MKIKNSILFVPVAALLVLNACTGQQDNVFGENKPAPDEFAVYSRAPLSLPPDFGLRPPKPGTTRPQTVMPRNDAKEALLSNSAQAPAKTAAQAELDQTAGVRALLSHTGADQANPDIRNIVNNETAALSGAGDKNFADSILFWRKSDVLKGAVIDPAVEERRMRIQKSKGEVVEETPTPKIERRGGGETRTDEGKGFWGSLFN